MKDFNKLEPVYDGYDDKLIKTKRFKEHCDFLAELYEEKNNDYGDSSHKTYEKFGLVSYAVRMNDKMNRFEQLAIYNTNQKVKDESVRDTLLDLASYAIQAAMEIE